MDAVDDTFVTVADRYDVGGEGMDSAVAGPLVAVQNGSREVECDVALVT